MDEDENRLTVISYSGAGFPHRKLQDYNHKITVQQKCQMRGVRDGMG